MKIAVRTRWPEFFFIFFSSFSNFYREHIKDLHVFIDMGENSDTDLSVFEKINYTESKRLMTNGFTIHPIYRNTMHEKLKSYNNYYANMIYQSMQFDEVISFDDDIVWLKNGFFDFINNVPNNCIFGQKYYHNDESTISLASYCMGTKNIPFTNKFLADELEYKQNFSKYNGNDAFKVHMLENIHWILNPKREDGSIKYNSVTTEYYYHISSVGYIYDCIKNRSIK